MLDQEGKSFGAIQALTDVSLQVVPGEIVGLVGDNGAGRSTLAKVIAGNFPPRSGRMLFNDKPAHFIRPVDARAAGIDRQKGRTAEAVDRRTRVTAAQPGR